MWVFEVLCKRYNKLICQGVSSEPEIITMVLFVFSGVLLPSHKNKIYTWLNCEVLLPCCLVSSDRETPSTVLHSKKKKKKSDIQLCHCLETKRRGSKKTWKQYAKKKKKYLQNELFRPKFLYAVSVWVTCQNKATVGRRSTDEKVLASSQLCQRFCCLSLTPAPQCSCYCSQRSYYFSTLNPCDPLHSLNHSRKQGEGWFLHI